MASLDICGCSLFNITVRSKITTNDSHLWSCACYYQFQALYDMSSSQINDISKCSIFSLSVQSAVILIHRSHLRLKTFNLQQTEMAYIIVLKTKLIVNHLSFRSYKTKQVSSSVNHLSLCCMIAKTITDFTFAFLEAIHIIVMIACINSNEKQYSSSGATEQLKYKMEKIFFVENGVAW